jgi:hypothetical protein
MIFFNVDPRIHIKLNILKIIVIWIWLIPQLKNFCNFHVIIQALKIKYIYANVMKTSTMIITFKSFIFMSYENKNTPCINRCAQIYKLIEVYIYFNPSWSWVNDVVWYTHALKFFQYKN